VHIEPDWLLIYRIAGDEEVDFERKLVVGRRSNKCHSSA